MRTVRFTWGLLTFATILASLGCSVTNERSIVGTYRAEASCVTITLVLNPDHSFLQTARTSSGHTNQVNGKWRIDNSNKSFEIVDFEPFLDFQIDHRGRNGEGPGETGFHAERWPRGILMGPIIVECPDSAEKIDYVK
jgi:hypothetical protein